MGFRSRHSKNVLTVPKCNELFRKARFCKYTNCKAVRLENNTYLIQYADCYAVQLHQTDIITIYPDKFVFRHNGWKTNTTKNRMERYSFINISVSKRIWYYRIGAWNNSTGLKEFENGLTLTKANALEYLI